VRRRPLSRAGWGGGAPDAVGGGRRCAGADRRRVRGGRSNTRYVVFYEAQQANPEYQEAGFPLLPCEPIQIERSGKKKGSFHARFQAPWLLEVPHGGVNPDGVATVVFKGQWLNPPGPAAPVLFGQVSVRTSDCRPAS
jgi:hypothetical protein